MKLGQLATHRDLEVFLGRNGQNGFLERRAADVRTTPPGHQKRLNARFLRQPHVPADHVRVIAVVIADQRLGFRTWRFGALQRPHAGRRVRTVGGLIPGVVHRPKGRLSLGSARGDQRG